MDELEKLFNELIVTIYSYESDTFSAEASKLTRSEAIKIAQRLIVPKIRGLIDCDTMDGVAISEELEDIRDEN